MKITSIGLIELSSIVRGIYITDVVAKTADVEILEANTICPGKFYILFSGDVAAVEEAVKNGVAAGEESIVGSFIIPHVHPDVIKAITRSTPVDKIEALGGVETFSIFSAIYAADASIKTANIKLIELRVANGLGGKAFYTLTGSVAAVRAAVEAGELSAKKDGSFLNSTVIPRPHDSVKKSFL